MNTNVPGLLCAAALLTLAGCAKPPATDPTVLATVGDRVIRVSDLQQELAWRRSARRNAPEQPELLAEMITQESLVQRARAAGLELDPEFQRAWRTLLVTRLKERELQPRMDAVQVSPEELRVATDAEQARHTLPAKARMALIRIKTDPKMSEARMAELRERIDEARARALALGPGVAGFASVAAEYSDDQASRYKGGEVGWFDAGQAHYRWPAAVISAGFSLESPDAISEVVRAEDGFYLVKKLDTRAATAAERAPIEERVRRRILAEKRGQAERAYANEARRAAGVQTFPEALAAIPRDAKTLARRTDGEPPSLP